MCVPCIENRTEDELSKRLLKRNAGAEAPVTSLQDAVVDGKAAVLDKMLRTTGSAQVNSRTNSGYTLLHIAASYGHADCVKVLLEHGADISALDEYGKTPMQTAMLSSKGWVVRLLRSESEQLKLMQYSLRVSGIQVG